MNMNILSKASPIIFVAGVIIGLFLISDAKKTISSASSISTATHENQDRNIDGVRANLSKVMLLPPSPVNILNFEKSLPIMERQFSVYSSFYDVRFGLVIGKQNSSENVVISEHVVSSDSRFPGVSFIPFSFSAHAKSLVSFSLMWGDISHFVPIALDEVKIKSSKDGISIEGKAVLFGGTNEV